MKIEDLVLSIEQAKHLQELGLDMSDAALYWASQATDSKGIAKKKREWFVHIGHSQITVGFVSFEFIPTYTLQEVLDKLPWMINYDGSKFILKIDYMCNSISYTISNTDLICFNFNNEKIINSAYNMLCWVLENGY